LKEAHGAYFVLRAQLRQFEVQLSARPEVERKLLDVSQKLHVFQQGQHTQVLQDYLRAENQRREIESTVGALHELPDRILLAADTVSIGSWPEGLFSDSETDVVAWRSAVEEVLRAARDGLQSIASTLREQQDNLKFDARLTTHLARLDSARLVFEDLRRNLAQQGITDFNAFGTLTHEHQQLDAELKRLDALHAERNEVQEKEREQLAKICDLRRAVTMKRADFIQSTLQGNEYVRISIEPYGFNARTIERELRELLDVLDDRFDRDILVTEEGDATGGLCYELARAASRDTTLQSIKTRLVGNDPSFGGHFRNYLSRKSENAEFLDRIRVWFPEDDLRIEYKRNGQWHPISHGSQGQRAAALLAFLLAFGNEPLILDQPEDDLDNHLVYDLIVKQIRENKLRRQLIIVTHNANVVVNGDAELVSAMDFQGGQCRVIQSGALQEEAVRNEVCRVMEGGREAFERRWHRLGRYV